MMIWEFNREGKANLTPKTRLPTMTLTSGSKTKRVYMTQLDNTTAQKTLGTMLSPSLQMHTELDTQKTKSTNYARKLLTNSLTPFEAYTAHHTTYIPSITYTFPITHHKKQH